MVCTHTPRFARSWRGVKPRTVNKQPIRQFMGSVCVLLYSQGKLCIPPTSEALTLQLLQQYHDSPLAGHYGVARTQALLAQYYTWPGLAGAVAK